MYWFQMIGANEFSQTFISAKSILQRQKFVVSTRRLVLQLAIDDKTLPLYLFIYLFIYLFSKKLISLNFFLILETEKDCEVNIPMVCDLLYGQKFQLTF